MSAPEPTPSSAPKYSGGQVAMLVIGVILLLPGLCSLVFLIAMFNDLLHGNTIARAIAPLWIICFFVAAGGVALIYAARKGARAAARSDAAGSAKP
jgi:hypothetical protein